MEMKKNAREAKHLWPESPCTRDHHALLRDKTAWRGMKLLYVTIYADDEAMLIVRECPECGAPVVKHIGEAPLPLTAQPVSG